MTVKLPAAGLTALQVSPWCYGIDIVLGCEGPGSLLMRAQIDQAAADLPSLETGRPCRAELTVIGAP